MTKLSLEAPGLARHPTSTWESSWLMCQCVSFSSVFCCHDHCVLHSVWRTGPDSTLYLCAQYAHFTKKQNFRKVFFYHAVYANVQLIVSSSSYFQLKESMYYIVILTGLFVSFCRNSSRTPVYSMSYNPAENCVLLCTVSDLYLHTHHCNQPGNKTKKISNSVINLHVI